MVASDIKVTVTCDADEYLTKLIETQISLADIAVNAARVQLDAEVSKQHDLLRRLAELKAKRSDTAAAPSEIQESRG